MIDTARYENMNLKELIAEKQVVEKRLKNVKKELKNTIKLIKFLKAKLKNFFNTKKSKAKKVRKC